MPQAANLGSSCRACACLGASFCGWRRSSARSELEAIHDLKVDVEVTMMHRRVGQRLGPQSIINVVHKKIDDQW